MPVIVFYLKYHFSITRITCLHPNEREEKNVLILIICYSYLIIKNLTQKWTYNIVHYAYLELFLSRNYNNSEWHCLGERKEKKKKKRCIYVTYFYAPDRFVQLYFYFCISSEIFISKFHSLVSCICNWIFLM